MIRSTPPWVRLLIVGLGSIVALSVGQLAAQDRATESDDDRQPPRFVDKGMGEEEQIERRREWFYGSRRDGTASADELWSLRLKGVTETKNLLANQRDRKALGREGEQNLWVSMGPSPSNFGGWAFGTVTGRIMAIESDWDGGILYAGSASGGLWKSTNDGLSWTNIFDTAGTVSVSAITLDPVDPSILWVGTGDNVSGCESYFGIGLLRSTDGGQNWEARNGSGTATLEDLSNFGGVTIDPRDSNKLVVGGRYRGCTTGSQSSGGIYTTTDGGANWTNRLANTQIHELARDPNVADVLWAGTNKGIYKSSNNGESWVLQTNSGLPNGSLSRTEIAIAPSNSNVVYALFNTPSDEFWRTTDGGATWTEMNQSACDGQCSYNMVIRVDPTNPDIIYRGTIKVFKSVNGGTTWSTLTNSWGGSQQVHQDTHSLLMHPTNSNVFYVGSDGGLWKSSTAGTTFENKNGNMNITQFYAIDVDANDPTRICGGAQDNSSLATDDNLVWSLQAVSGDGFICQFNPVNTNYHYITSYPSGGYPSIWRSTNGMFGNFSGVTGAGSGIIGGDSIAWVTPYLLDPTNPSTLYVGTHRVYRSTNNGGTWTHVGPSNLAGGGQLRVIEINRNYPDVLFSGASTGVVWTTENQGTSWTDITSGLPSRAINDIAADPTNPDRAFAAVGGFNQGHVWEWNAGEGWVERSNGLPNVPANSVLMVDDMDILVGMDTGIFRSTDGGASFLPFMAGLPEGLVVMDIKFNTLQNMVSAGTYGRGVWQASLGEVQPILLSEAVEQPLLEVDGDGDDKIEPGETWSVKPILRNAGGVAALGVNARLASATPGVSILSPQVGSFGDLEPGLTLAVSTAFQFTVDPLFECGTEIVFDLADITSTAPPGNYLTQAEIYTVAVLDENEPPVVTPIFEESFDPAPAQGWDHEPAGNAPAPCAFLPTIDEWMLASKDAEHGTSFHAGGGPGGEYGRRNYAWLHPTGKDSEGGSGILIPSDALAVSLSVVHWYDITFSQDGGNVAIDTVEDGSDSYSTLSPVGDYPSSIPTGWCNAMEGQDVFAGTSDGWITSTFDLTQFKGKRIWPAFVFGTGRRDISGEGWYIDDVKIEFLLPGAPVCDVSRWPGVVEAAQFELESGGTILARWDDSCSLPEFPDQAYSIQVGNLDALVAGAGYSHIPLDGECGLLSSTSFMPGPGNEYYVIVPTGEGREGGAGMDSKNVSRPQPSTSCGVQRERCP